VNLVYLLIYLKYIAFMEPGIFSPRSQRPVESYVEAETWLFHWIFCIEFQFSNSMFWKLNLCHYHVRGVLFG
jgi:hypothetical protein